jgi:hypothetical protein
VKAVDAVLCEGLAEITALMKEADERRRWGIARPKRAVESDLKSAVREVAGPRAVTAGLGLEARERTIAPEDWPRVGPVDVVFTHQSTAEASPVAAFVELKWVHEERLWYVAWDLAKSALVSRLGLAERAFCIVGFLDSERETRYGELIAARRWEMPRFLEQFHDAMKPFCFREPGRELPTGPLRLPARMDVTRVCDQHTRQRTLPWTLSVLEVRAPGDRWVAVDDRGLPT